jgi:hypothetical protein
MTCVYTGASVYFPEYGFYAPADLYLVGAAVIIRWNVEGKYYTTVDRAAASHQAITRNGWHREDLGVTVVPLLDLTGEAFR